MRRRSRAVFQTTALSRFIVSLRTAVSVYEGAAGQVTTLTVPVDRSGNLGYPGQVQWGVSGIGASPATVADFGGSYPSDFVSFGPQDLTANIEIAIHGNDTEEGDRTFSLSLNAPSTDGGSGIASIGVGSIVCTILDDDAAQPTSNVEYGTNPAYYGGNPCDYNG